MNSLLERSVLLAGGPLLTLVSACESQKPKYEGPYAAEVAEAVPMIEKAVGLKYKTPPKVETRSKDQVREFVIKQFTDSLATHDIAGQEAAYKQLGMIPDTLKLEPFGPAHVLTGFKHVGKPVPVDLRQTIRNMKKKAWLNFTDIENLRVATEGENEVEFKLPRSRGKGANGKA